MKTVMIILGVLLFGGILVGVMISETFKTLLFGTTLTFLFLSFLLFLFGLVSPLFVHFLVNNPKDEPIMPNRIHFFTFIEPGQVKIIVRGKSFVRAIMNDSERKFRGSKGRITPDNADYWWVIPAKPGGGTKPLSPFNWKSPISWWSHWVYRNTGAVFTGIWPFQTVRVEKNQRIRQKKENGKVILDNKGLPVLEDVEDYSDHLRVKGFFWYFKIPVVDTKDYLKMGFEGNLLVRCINPYLATYNQDRWDNAVSLKASTLITQFCQTKVFSELSAANDANNSDIGNFLLEELNKALFSSEQPGTAEKKGIGLEVLHADITDRDPQLDEKERSSLTEPWRAEQAKKAAITASEGVRQKTINEAEGTKQKLISESEGQKQKIINISEGEARAIINRITAIKSDSEIGEMLAKYDAWQKSAEAGGATYFFGDSRSGSKELDPIIFAKLKEIRKIREEFAEKNKNEGGV